MAVPSMGQSLLGEEPADLFHQERFPSSSEAAALRRKGDWQAIGKHRLEVLCQGDARLAGRRGGRQPRPATTSSEWCATSGGWSRGITRSWPGALPRQRRALPAGAAGGCSTTRTRGRWRARQSWKGRLCSSTSDISRSRRCLSVISPSSATPAPAPDMRWNSRMALSSRCIWAVCARMLTSFWYCWAEFIA